MSRTQSRNNTTQLAAGLGACIATCVESNEVLHPDVEVAIQSVQAHDGKEREEVQAINLRCRKSRRRAPALVRKVTIRAMLILILVPATTLGVSFMVRQSVKPQIPVIRNAYSEAEQVCFEAGRGLNWEDVARRYFRAFDLDNPDREALRKNRSEPARTSSFEYRAPLPRRWRMSFYYLLGEARVLAVRPTALKGQITYTTNEHVTEALAPRFSGLACSRLNPLGPRDAGFIIESATKLSFRMQPIAMSVAPHVPRLTKEVRQESTTYSLVNESKMRLEIATYKQPAPEIRVAYLVTIYPGTRRYLFLRWAPDHGCHYGCCEYWYSLFVVGEKLTLEAENRYACDV